MKNSTLFITFAGIIIVFFNLFSLYSCSTEELEEDEVYSLANSTRKRVGEGGNNGGGKVEMEM